MLRHRCRQTGERTAHPHTDAQCEIMQKKKKKSGRGTEKLQKVGKSTCTQEKVGGTAHTQINKYARILAVGEKKGC